MKIGITGVTGFIGSRIAGLAKERGHHVIGFTRDRSLEIAGCAEMRTFAPNEKLSIEGCEAFIHLAGEPVFGIWTKEKRRRILESRTEGTRRLVDAIISSANPPRVLVAGSAIGYYGDTGENEVDEDSSPGTGFLADVTLAWEAEAVRARQRDVRVVLLRTSIVLGRKGGSMQIMVPLFRSGLGGELGSGRQWMSWIHIDDEASLALLAVENGRLAGPLNAVASKPCRNSEFTRALARAIERPAFLNVPAFVLKTLLGGFSHELLDSKRIVSRHALETGPHYRFPTLESALADILHSRE